MKPNTSVRATTLDLDPRLGSATVEFADDGETLDLRAGDVVRLAAGTHTVWSVTETLRKVYLA